VSLVGGNCLREPEETECPIMIKVGPDS
jgi:hypothetical protein